MTGAHPAGHVVAMRRPTLVDVPPMPSLPATMILRRARVECGWWRRMRTDVGKVWREQW